MEDGKKEMMKACDREYKNILYPPYTLHVSQASTVDLYSVATYSGILSSGISTTNNTQQRLGY